MKSIITALFLSLVYLCSCSPEVQQRKSPHQIKDELSIAINEDIQTLDPRKVRNLISINVVNCLYEGLVKYGTDGSIQKALADTIEVSPDHKNYTFQLKNAYWSNGDKITAKDFEYSWKSQLTKEFAAPYNYLLFVLKGAKDAFDGKDIVDNIGVFSVDEMTLLVSLEAPVPCFLQLLTSSPFLPVNQKIASEKSEAISGHDGQLISNGPFMLNSWKPQNELHVKKNPMFRNASVVSLTGVKFIYLEGNTALNLFENGQIDWIGSPLSSIPIDALPSMKNILISIPAYGVGYCTVNCHAFPFSNLKIRKAFCYAINRTELAKNLLQGNYAPLTSFIPPDMMLSNKPYFVDNDKKTAQRVFNEALTDLSLTKDDIHTTLTYVPLERNQKTAQILQQTWKNVLGVEVSLQPLEYKLFTDKISKDDFALSLSTHFADYNDPVNFLQAFFSANTIDDHTGWSNAKYQQLLQLGERELNSEKRLEILTQAESLLMDALPIFPLFQFSFNYAKNKALHDVSVSPLGIMNIEQGYFSYE